MFSFSKPAQQVAPPTPEALAVLLTKETLTIKEAAAIIASSHELLMEQKLGLLWTYSKTRIEAEAAMSTVTAPATAKPPNDFSDERGSLCFGAPKTVEPLKDLRGPHISNPKPTYDVQLVRPSAYQG